MRSSPLKSSTYNPLRSFNPNVIRSPELQLPDSPEKRILSGAAQEIEYWKRKAREFQNVALNLEDQLAFLRVNLQKVQQQEQKIDVLLKQNTHLLSENQSLLRVIHQKKLQVQTWKQRADSQYINQENIKANFQVNTKKAIDEIEKKQLQHRIEIDRLMNEISRLQDHCSEIQSLKNIQLENLKAKYQNQSLMQMQSLKRSQNGNIQLFQKQVRRLKDQIQKKDIEAEQTSRKNKIQSEKQSGEITKLNAEVKKLKNSHDQQLQLFKTQAEQQLYQQKRQAKKREEDLNNTLNLRIKRLEHQNKKLNQAVQETELKVQQSKGTGDADLDEAKVQKSKLRSQINMNNTSHEQDLQRQKDRHQDALRYEVKVLADGHQQKVNFLQIELGLMRSMLESKNDQISKLIKQMEQLRASFYQLQSQKNEQISQLKRKIHDIIQNSTREIQTMKIRQAHLYQADIETLRKIFEKQAQTLNKQIDYLRSIVKGRNQEIQKLLHEKANLRRTYQKEIDHHHSHSQQSKIDFKNQIVQKDREMRNSVSKVQLISQGLIKDNDSAAAKNKFLQAQVAKLKTIVEDRNKQIKILNEKNKKLLEQMSSETDRLTKLIQDLSRQLEEIKKKSDTNTSNYRQQLLKKQKLYQKLNKQMSDQIAELHKKLAEQNKIIDDLKHQINIKKSEIEQIVDKMNTERQHQAAQKGNSQKLVFQTQTAHNQNKQKLLEHHKEQMDQLRKSMKQKLINYQIEIQQLKKLLSLRSRELQQKQARELTLEQQLDALRDSSGRLKDLQNRVINIGSDRNYLKNITEMFRIRHS